MLSLGQRLLIYDHKIDMVLVLRTANGKLYHAEGRGENAGAAMESLIRALIINGDTEVKKIVSLFGPSVSGAIHWIVRQELPKINPKNYEAEILLQAGEPGLYGSKTLGQLYGRG
jgi:hypothetical protein